MGLPAKKQPLALQDKGDPVELSKRAVAVARHYKQELIKAQNRIAKLEAQLENADGTKVDDVDAEILKQVAKDKEIVVEYLFEARETLTQIKQLLSSKNSLPVEAIESLFRQMHSLKGGASMCYMVEVEKLAHKTEDDLERFKQTGGAETEDVKYLNTRVMSIEHALMEFIEKHKDILGDSMESVGRKIVLSSKVIVDFYENHVLFSDNPDLQKDYIENFLNEPVIRFVKKFSDLSQEIASKQGKQLNPIEFEGGEIRVMAERYLHLFSALIHAFRNAVDHGLEDPSERTTKGKNPAGSMKVRFENIEEENGHKYLLIEIQDDGRGIDPNIIRKKLIEKKLPFNPKETPVEIIQHIFDAGFSTRDQVTDLSGRGIGMDAISHAVKLLSGRVTVESKQGMGTKIKIHIPT